MDSLSSFMGGQQSQLFKIARAAQAVSQAQVVFDELYPGVSAHVRVISFKEGVLRVAAVSSTVISDIRLRESDILQRVNNASASLHVEQIICLASDSSMR